MTDRLNEIQARWAKAQPGPWRAEWIDEEMSEGAVCIPHPHHDICRDTVPVEVLHSEPGLTVAAADGAKLCTVSVGCFDGDASDAAAIAAAPEDIRWLVREVNELRDIVAATSRAINPNGRVTLGHCKAVADLIARRVGRGTTGGTDGRA
jgi:hypothetical protein